MPRYLIEVPHEPEKLECLRTIQVFLQTGSHFLTNADWGCSDGQHAAWITLEAGSKEEARLVLPPAFRARAKIVGLTRFKLEEIDKSLAQHQG